MTGSKIEVVGGPAKAPEYGYCPFISTVTMIPRPIKGAPGMVDMVPTVLKAGCLGPDCNLWNDSVRRCVFGVRRIEPENAADGSA